MDKLVRTRIIELSAHIIALAALPASEKTYLKINFTNDTLELNKKLLAELEMTRKKFVRTN